MPRELHNIAGIFFSWFRPKLREARLGQSRGEITVAIRCDPIILHHERADWRANRTGAKRCDCRHSGLAVGPAMYAARLVRNVAKEGKRTACRPSKGSSPSR